MFDDEISHKTMLNILNDLSPFKNSYVIGFILIIVTSFILSPYLTNYAGFLPFSVSMKLASTQVKLLNDLIIIYFILICLLMLFKYMLIGLSLPVIQNFKNAAKNPNRNVKKDVGENPKKQILYTALFLLLINLLWVWIFGFTSAGNSKILRNILKDSNFFINLYIVLGFLGNLYLFIFSILMIEGRKYVVFLRKW